MKKKLQIIIAIVVILTFVLGYAANQLWRPKQQEPKQESPEATSSSSNQPDANDSDNSPLGN